ncbi:TPA: 3-phosphoshikimate 1-carboxyvinyltransferase [Candidatus Bipolaricaulota bacterium]|nr:3-phosphoshikimate 1-carboxyvinyltransferase [Candidatus Bipolaricaulota bacterium]
MAIPLSQMGAHIKGDGERCYPPVRICGGRLRAITYDMPIASAQVKSAIMLAGLFADGTTVIKQPALSRDHTERMLCVFGAEVSVEGMIISVRGGAKLRAQHLRIPGGISSAAFFLAASAAMPKSQVTVTRVGVNPTRTGMLDALRMMGVDVEISNEREECGEPVADITVCGVKRLRGIALNGPIIPRMIDELPLIAVLCAVADGESEIRDAAELRLKECDRIKAMAEGLRKMGACIDELPDGWRISGVSQLHGAHVDSYRDHRIAMALAIAGLLADGETVIDGAECVSISFPKFWATLEQLRS